MLHFLTNNSNSGIANLPTWFDECVAVQAGYLESLHFTQGDNFTCSEEPIPTPPSPPPGGGKLFAESSFSLARTEVAMDVSPVRAVVFVTAEPYTAMPYGRGDVLHSKRLLGQYKLWVGGAEKVWLVGIGPGRADDNASIVYDTFDVTTLVQAAVSSTAQSQSSNNRVDRVVDTHTIGTVAISLQGYQTNPHTRYMLELHITHANGTRTIHGTNPSTWKAFDASRAFGLAPTTVTTGGYYEGPQENTDARLCVALNDHCSLARIALLTSLRFYCTLWFSIPSVVIRAMICNRCPEFVRLWHSFCL